LTKPKSPSLTSKSHKKVLSQAALKRLQNEADEAAKTKVQVLAEKIKRRSTVLTKHDSVVANSKPKPKQELKITLKPLTKVRQQKAQSFATPFEEFEALQKKRTNDIHRILKKAGVIRDRIELLTKREAVKFQEALRDCYGLYQYIQSTEEPYHYYDVLRSYFRKTGEIQSNSPDEGLLVRYVFSKRSNKQVSEYATVLRYALETKVPQTRFIDWYTTTTQTRILQKARKEGAALTNDRLHRSRILLQQYFDIREQHPLGHFDYPLMLAQKQVHLPDDLIIVVCRGINTFNRDSDFKFNGTPVVPLASISALHFIPPNVDLANDIMNRIARYIEPRLEYFEAEIQQKSEQVWSTDMTNFLTERELGAAYRSADKWADRMQAATQEDQKAFEEQRRKIQKLRNKSRQ
jgi:hypothetical protein